jgi:hypothetical protein
MKRLSGVFFILMFFVTGLARAGQLFEYTRPVRAMGMGGMFLPFVDEDNAVMWNPAVLSTVDQLSLQIFELGVGANGIEVYDLYMQMQDSACTGSACYDPFYGQPIWVGLHGKVSLVGPRMGILLYSGGYLSGTLHNPAFPSFNLTFLNDNILEVAYGFPIQENFHGGVTLKRVNRWGGTEDIGLSTITTAGASVLDNFNQRGTGYGFDLGLQYKNPGPVASIFAVHWQDVGSTAFVEQSNYSQPPRIKDNLSVGLGAEIDLPGLDLRVGVEARHLTEPEHQIGKKLHGGVELGIPFIDVRTGLNQGYPTIGLTMDFFFLKLDAASYTEEEGVYPGQSPSARYQISLSLDLAVDADFKFPRKDGTRRKLKQRR